MAKYTTELRDIVKSGVNIFDFDYRFYNDSKKSEFEQKFIDHFYFREIGQETTGRFIHYLKCKCQESLPYYNVLLETAEYEYDLKNNYNLTETFTKTNSNSKTLTGNINQNGTTNNTETTTRNNTNNLTSNSTHTENNDFTRTENITENGQLDNTVSQIVDSKKVGSDTPNALLSMVDIKNNVYASKVDIEDNTNETTNNQTNSVEKNGTTSEITTNSVTDNVTATNTDNATGTSQNNGIITSATTSNQNEHDNGSESYTLERVGDIGVDTTPDKLKKHVEFQKIVTTAYLQFFNECEDLFMQIF